MKRLRTNNINTPDHFDQEWKDPSQYRWDSVRMRALTFGVVNGNKVLDVGAGLFGACEYISSQTNLKCELHCVDFSSTAHDIVVKKCPEINFKIGRIEELDYPDDSFDCVICGEVIEHMEDPEGLVKELARVCKQGGLISLGTVDTNCSNARKLEYPEHLWEFTPDDLIGFFKPFGNTQYTTVGDYHFIYCKKHASISTIIPKAKIFEADR